MTYHRRELLAAGLAAVVGVSGCLSSESNVRYPSAAATDAETGAVDVGDDPRAAQSDDGDDVTANDVATRSLPNPALAETTAAVFDELRWFALDYDGAVQQYKTAMAHGASVLAEVRDATLDEETLDRVVAETDEVGSTVESALAPHFLAHRRIADANRYHGRITRKFARRGDVDRAKEELDRWRAFFAGRETATFVRDELSNDPVQNRLVPRLAQGEAFPERHDRLLLGLSHPASGYRTYAYTGVRHDFTSTPVTDETGADYRPRFDPLAVADGRDDEAVLAARVLPGGSTSRDATSFDANVVYLQRFEDTRAATEAVESLLDGHVTQEGTYPIGETAWRRVYFQQGDDVTYAFLVQAGRYVLAAEPSRTAWEERVDWSTPLEHTWLWQ